MRTSKITLQCYSSGAVWKELLRLETKSFRQMPGTNRPMPYHKSFIVKLPI